MGEQPYGQPMQPPMQPQGAGAKWGPTSIGSLEAHIAAGIGYLTPIAGLIFFLMEKTNKFVRFHAMQSIVLGVAYVVYFVVLSIIQSVITIGSSAADAATNSSSLFSVGGSALSCGLSCLWFVGGLAFFGLWLWGIISAFTGKYTKLPVIGNLAEKWAGGPAVPAY